MNNWPKFTFHKPMWSIQTLSDELDVPVAYNSPNRCGTREQTVQMLQHYKLRSIEVCGCSNNYNGTL